MSVAILLIQPRQRSRKVQDGVLLELSTTLLLWVVAFALIQLFVAWVILLTLDLEQQVIQRYVFDRVGPIQVNDDLLGFLVHLIRIGVRHQIICQQNLRGRSVLSVVSVDLRWRLVLAWLLREERALRLGKREDVGQTRRRLLGVVLMVLAFLIHF